MISQKMQDAFNDQINAELYSSYLYLAMSGYFESVNLPGCGNWMRVQAQEEIVHAMKMYHFVVERGGRVEMQPIEGPPKEWDSPLAAFEAGYGHEQKVTARINNLMDTAIGEKDHASQIFLQWFVSEQVEEEASADEVVQQFKKVGDKGHVILMLDRELGKRSFAYPASISEED